ncbi:MAG: TetR/AcrR family transcriptional regulator [Lachnospiraceae bacterium]|nr:TetR/AcrR family transcriptional regulator [Lachnospiraceae bacterium]
MPKSYSEQEKEYIKKRLKEEAAKCLVRYGVRRTTVDEIVQRVNIPKGTFYLFYKSKELLLFEVILEQHEVIVEKMYKAVSEMKQDGDMAEQLTKIVCDFFILASKSPILKMIDSNEVEILARKLPPEILEKHLEYDSSAVEKVFSELPIKEGKDKDTFSAAFRAVYFATLHVEEIGEKYFEDVLYLLIKGLVNQIV